MDGSNSQTHTDSRQKAPSEKLLLEINTCVSLDDVAYLLIFILRKCWLESITRKAQMVSVNVTKHVLLCL